MNRFLNAFALAILSSVAIADSQESSLVAVPLLEHLRMTDLIEYRCRPSYRCEIDCSAGEGQRQMTRQNVHRMELALNNDLLLVAAAYTDAVGKAHQSTAILPRPAGCILDNLQVQSVSPIVGGELNRPAGKDEVIFDVQPDR